MKAAKVGTLAWLAIYVGMALLGLGLSLRSDDADLGFAVALVGGIGVATGAALVWLRSRMNDGTGS